MAAKRLGHSYIVTLALVLVSAVSICHAGVMIGITEEGGDVVVTTSGSADISTWGGPGGTTDNAIRFSINNGAQGEFISFGAGDQQWWTSPNGGSFTFTDHGFADDDIVITTGLILTSGGGDVGFRLTGVGLVWLPLGYVSGTPINMVVTIPGESFASLGLEDGDWAIFEWDGPGADSIIMAVGSAIPVELMTFTVE